jgi:peptide methionine sulfoxide reductase MsrB
MVRVAHFVTFASGGQAEVTCRPIFPELPFFNMAQDYKSAAVWPSFSSDLSVVTLDIFSNRKLRALKEKSKLISSELLAK